MACAQSPMRLILSRMRHDEPDLRGLRGHPSAGSADPAAGRGVAPVDLRRVRCAGRGHRRGPVDAASAPRAVGVGRHRAPPAGGAPRRAAHPLRGRADAAAAGRLSRARRVAAAARAGGAPGGARAAEPGRAPARPVGRGTARPARRPAGGRGTAAADAGRPEGGGRDGADHRPGDRCRVPQRSASAGAPWSGCSWPRPG